jgi:hypothetical protein
MNESSASCLAAMMDMNESSASCMAAMMDMNESSASCMAAMTNMHDDSRLFPVAISLRVCNGIGDCNTSQNDRFMV